MRFNWILVALCFSSACIVEAPGGDKSQDRAAAVVQQVPPLSMRLGANLEGKVELVAVAVQPGKIAPGEQARVTIFFKVIEELDKDYIVFVHVEDADGRDRMNLDHRPSGGTYPTTKWRKGETVKDEFPLQLPPGLTARRLNLWAGLWDPQADARLRLRNPDAVRNDGSNRVLLAQVPVGR